MTKTRLAKKCLAKKINSYCYTIFLYNDNKTRLFYDSRSYYDKINNIYLKQQNSMIGDVIKNACQAD